MHFLSVVAIFKNESHIIKEWVQHYLNEGVDHFYLIDNGSTDEYQSEIESFQKDGLITLIKDDTRWAQVDLYNKHFLPMREESTWLVISDLDEFIYATNGYKKISDFLNSLSEEIGAIRIPWKMFGSSGYIDQPPSVIHSFVQRASYRKKFRQLRKTSKALSKVIVKSNFLKSYHIHFSYLEGNPKVIAADGQALPYPEPDIERNDQPISEEFLNMSYLQLNHYPLQSKDWFLNVKCTRGAADTKTHENVRDYSYFKSYDKRSNVLTDRELATKKY